jgi:ethanolamine ammonia-lyase small subunit
MSSPGTAVDTLRAIAREATPARVFLTGAGTSYATHDLLRLRADHAAAKDALRAVVGPEHPALRAVADRHGLISLTTTAGSHREYLVRPDLGRRLSESSVRLLEQQGTRGADIQLILGDGLSPDALAERGPAVVDGVHSAAVARGWSLGVPIFVKHARVGILNDIGTITGCGLAILLIGERPGLQTPRSLSAYFAYAPRSGQTDADRNLVCNIHSDGLAIPDAVRRVIDLATAIRAAGISGIAVKESPEPPERRERLHDPERREAPDALQPADHADARPQRLRHLDASGEPEGPLRRPRILGGDREAVRRVQNGRSVPG